MLDRRVGLYSGRLAGINVFYLINFYFRALDTNPILYFVNHWVDGDKPHTFCIKAQVFFYIHILILKITHNWIGGSK